MEQMKVRLNDLDIYMYPVKYKGYMRYISEKMYKARLLNGDADIIGYIVTYLPNSSTSVINYHISSNPTQEDGLSFLTCSLQEHN